MRSFVLVSGFIALCYGAVLNTAPTCKTIDDNYDDLAAPPVVAQVGTYHGLTYQGFTVTSLTAPTSPLVPHSSPNTAQVIVRSDIIQIGTVPLHPFGNIVAASGTKAFNLLYFYFGCAEQDGQGTAAVAVGCTIALTGFNIQGQQVPTVTFAFSPTGLMQQSLKLVTLPAGYTGLKNVTYGISAGGTAGDYTNTVLAIDDLVHCNYT